MANVLALRGGLHPQPMLCSQELRVLLKPLLRCCRATTRRVCKFSGVDDGTEDRSKAADRVKEEAREPGRLSTGRRSRHGVLAQESGRLSTGRRRRHGVSVTFPGTA